MLEPREVFLLNQKHYTKERPGLDDLNLICRLCLQTVIKSEDAPLISIHDEHYEMNVKSLIEMYTFLKLPDKGVRVGQAMLPTNICIDCADFLIEMHTFRSRSCLNNDILLKLIEGQESDEPSVAVTDVPLETEAETPNENGGNDQNEEPKQEQLKSDFELISRRISNEIFGIFECPKCDQVFQDDFMLDEHECNLRLRDKDIKLFSSTVVLYPVWAPTINGEQVQVGICYFCRMGFTDRESYDNHLENEHNDTNDRNEIPLTKIQTDGTRLFLCCEQFCKETFKTQPALREHLRKHIKGKQHMCNECHKGFNLRFALINHMLIHTGKCPFACTSCDKTFRSKGRLEIHLRTHTGEKKYICHFCAKTFTVATQLTAHLRSHTGEKPFICEYCARGFSVKQNLDVHRRLHMKKAMEMEKNTKQNKRKRKKL